MLADDVKVWLRVEYLTVCELTTLIHLQKLPKQEFGNDCGVFTIMVMHINAYIHITHLYHYQNNNLSSVRSLQDQRGQLQLHHCMYEPLLLRFT